MMQTIFEHFEDLLLEYMESRVAELLTQGDVSPKVTAKVRESAAWAAEKAIARFVAQDVDSSRRRHGNH